MKFDSKEFSGIAVGIRQATVFTVIALLTFSCGRTSVERNTISLDREVLVTGLGGAVAITKVSGDGLVVTGGAGSTWVIATDSRGELLWQFTDPPIKNAISIPGQLATVYNNVVPLPNGNVLLCGRRNHPRSTSNLILILDRDGKVVEQREERPDVAKAITRSAFRECISWKGGALLLGGVEFAAEDNRRWIVQLDSNGNKVAEFFFLNSDIYGLIGKNSVDSTDAAYVDIIPDTNGKYLYYEVTSRGQVVATRPLDDNYATTKTLRNLEPSSTMQIVMLPLRGKSIRYTMNTRLEDVIPAQPIDRFDVSQGNGYVFPNGSLALFGSEGNAAAAWIASNGERIATRVFDKRYNSYTINDVVAISANEFVTVRNGVTNDPNGGGVVLDWLTFQSDKKSFP